MVLNKLMITTAADDTVRPPKRQPKRKAKKTVDTPTASERLTPASASTPAHVTRDKSETPLFGRDEDEELRVHPLDSAPAPTPTNNDVVNTIEQTTTGEPEPEDETNAIVFDPTTSERQYYRDPYTGTRREIWRPGDGDGDKYADPYDKPGGQPVIAKRWRLYQSRTGNGPLIPKVNEPPKYVVLDDRAAYELEISSLPRSSRSTYWSHDFAATGLLRSRRPHRGRGAIGDADAEGNDKFHFAVDKHKKSKGERYYFTGQKDYKAIIWRIPPQQEGEASSGAGDKRKVTSPAPDEENEPPRKKGHNQHTPKNQLVKFGAPSQAKNRSRYRARINEFLRRSPSPEWCKDRGKLYGNVGEQARAFTASMGLQGASGMNEEAGDEMMADVSAAADDEDELFPRPSTDMQAGEAATEKPRQRKKIPQSLSAMERMAAEADDMQAAPIEPRTFDSGSYASQLEGQLAEAQLKIEELTAALADAEKKIEELEDEVEELREAVSNGEAEAAVV